MKLVNFTLHFIHAVTISSHVVDETLTKVVAQQIQWNEKSPKHNVDFIVGDWLALNLKIGENEIL